jgi:RNA polymerase sigma factor (sigma-70 family)
MGAGKDNEERRLVEQCLCGSQEAWIELYRRYAALVRRVIRDQKWALSPPDVEDVTQNVFLDLVQALAKFDWTYGLSQFICGVAKRTTRDEIRRRTAAKRSGETNPFDSASGREEQGLPGSCDSVSQETQLADEELKEILRIGLTKMGEYCRKLIALRDFEERPYKEIELLLGERENTLTVNRKRCLEELTAICRRLLREGCER